MRPYDLRNPNDDVNRMVELTRQSPQKFQRNFCGIEGRSEYILMTPTPILPRGGFLKLVWGELYLHPS